jgi:peptide/nickel transport system substrate-binding protein
MLVGGCTGGSSDGDEASGPVSDTLVVAIPTFETESPFPWEHNALGRPPFMGTMETLLMEDPETGELGPNLAESWEANEDSTTWTFKLQKGIQFHGGYGELTSADVLYTFERGREPGATGGLAQSWAQYFESVEAPDPYTFVLNFKTPMLTIGMMGAFAGQTGIHSKAYIEEVGDEVARTNPIGTGPYEFVSGEPGNELRYEAVEDHHRHTAGFKNLVIRRIPDANTIASALRAGEVDAAVVSGSAIDVLGDSVQFFEQEQGVPNWMVFPETEPAGTPQHRPDLPWNPSDPNDPEAVEKARMVREAMNLGFNKEAVIDSIWRGRATADVPFSWYVRPWHSGYQEDWPSVPGHDPERAIELLEEAGYADGFTFPVVISQLQPDSAQILPAFAQDMEKIGITVEVASMEHATLVGELRAKTLGEAFIYAVPAPGEQFSQASAMSQNSPFRFLNTFPEWWPRADAAMSESIEVQDEFVDEAVQMLHEEFATIPIGIQSTVVAASDEVAEWPLVPGMPLLHNFEYAVPAGN